jgi:hypothetical protein
MPRSRYISPIVLEPQVIRKYDPILKHVIEDVHNPSFNSVIIDTFYSLVFAHHIPILMRGQGIIGDTKLFDVSSLSDFLQCYIGKILFYLLINLILQYLLIPSVKSIKVSTIKKHISSLHLGKKSEQKKSEEKKIKVEKSEEKKN